MRLFNPTKLIAIGLSAFLAATCGASAGDTSYYSGKPWEIVLHVPDAQNERPYCAFRTTLWETRAISIETMIGAGDAMTMALRVRKEAWKLPLNQTTTVATESVAGMGAEVPMKAISEHELYSNVPAASVLEYNFMFATTLQLMLAKRQPQPLFIKFSGNEPLWTVPALDRFQAFEINEAFKRCDLDLRGLQSKAEQNDSSQQATSPFSAASQTGQPLVQPSVSTQLPAAPSDWEFYTRDEDWGHTCFAQTHHGIVMVGFMGSPGKDDLVGFVSSLFSGDTRATWHVDEKPAYVSDGGESDYFGWHEFGQLPMELLDLMAQGTELAVTGAKGERVAVRLTGAADVLSKFKGCFSKP
ncbi:hypothetical protein ACCS51_26635 [Rhizobium ruizarguesonis]